MSFFENKYNVTGWRGDKHSLTAKQLYDRVLEDSKSDHRVGLHQLQSLLEYVMIHAFQKCMQ